MALPGYQISRVPGADTAAVGRGRGVCPRTRVPYTGGNCLQAIEKPLHLHGRSPGPRGVVGSSRAVGASILGGLWEPRVLWGAATSGRGDTVTTPGPGSSAVTEKFSICVRKDQPHHRRWHRGDTSHSRPAPCDVALEVSRGQTGSLGWYPVLNTRLFAKCRDTKTPGRGACPQGTLSPVAENTPTLPSSQGLSLSPPQAPKVPTSPTLGISCQLSVLTLGPPPFQMDLKPPSYIQVWPCLKAATGPAAFRRELTVLDAPPAGVSHPVFTSPGIIAITASHTDQHPDPHRPSRLYSCLSLCPTPCRTNSSFCPKPSLSTITSRKPLSLQMCSEVPPGSPKNNPRISLYSPDHFWVHCFPVSPHWGRNYVPLYTH